MVEQVYAYPLGDALYLNVTNSCTHDCLFCIRRTREGLGSYELWLNKEPDLKVLLEAAKDHRLFREVVFCGYGEPLMRPDLVMEAARELKRQGALIRVNTNGQANLIHGRNIAAELGGLVDVASISLNSADPRQYVEICRPRDGLPAYQALLEFIEESKKHIPRVVLTAVTWPGVDLARCGELAGKLGVDFRARRLSGTFTFS